MQRKNNIEDFLRKSADNLASEYQDDWNAFDQKLSQAIYARRLRRATAMGAASVVLIFLFMGINAYQLFNVTEFYTPRTEPIVFESEISEPFSQQADVVKATENANPNAKKPNNSVNNAIVGNASSVSSNNDIVSKDGLSSTSGGGVFNNAGLQVSLGGDNPNPEHADFLIAAVNPENADANDELGEYAEFQESVQLNRAKGLGVFDHSKEANSLNNKANEKYLYFNVPGLSGDNSSYVSALSLRPPTQTFTIASERTGAYISPYQEKNPWSVSLNVYPNFTFRKFVLDEDKANLLHTDFADAVQAAESGGFSLNLGLEVSKRIGAVTYLNTGVEYISYKTEVLYNFTNFREAIINKNNGFIDGYTLKDKAERISFSDKNIYHYVNFPLSISYQPWASDHVRLNIEAGGSFLYFVTANGQTLDYQTLDVIDLSERDFKNSIGSLSFKVGVNYYVSQRLNVGFEPTLMYFTNTIYNDDYPFYVIPYSVGMNFNLQVKLN